MARDEISKKFVHQWTVLGLVLLLLGGFGVYAQHDQYQLIDIQERDRLATQVKVINDNLTLQLTGVKLALDGIIADLPMWQGDAGWKQANNRLTAMANAMPGIRTMLILDAQGNCLASNLDPLIGKNFKRRDYFQVPLLNPNISTLYISPPFKTITDTFVMSINRIIPGPEGKFAGIINASIDPNYFAVLLESVRYAPDMWTALAHGDGTLFMSAPGGQGRPGVNLAQPGSFFTRHKESGLPITILTGKVYTTGEERMMAQHTIRPASLNMDKPLVVAAGRNLSAIFAPWRREAIIQGVLFAMLALASAAGLFLYQRWRKKVETQRQQEQKELRDSQARFRSIFERANTGIAFTDALGNVITCNNRFAQIVGYLPEELTGRNFGQLTHPDDLVAELELFREIQAGARDDYRIEKRYIGKSGELLWVDLATAVIRDEQGQPVNFIGSVVDITERKQAEAALYEAKHAAEAANRAKSEFLANMSHEIRTPMSAVLGLLQLLQRTELSAQQQDYVQKVEEASRSLLGILNDILDFSKVEAGRMELEQTSFRLDKVMRNLSVILSSNLRHKEVEVLFNVPAGLPKALKGDALRLQQVLLNLAGNAVKFTERGEVVLSIRVLWQNPASVELEFAVKDTGIGIAPDKLETIFNGFTQAESSTTRRFGGTGLGLAISQRLVRLMGGELKVQSQLGQGSIFSFTVVFAIDREQEQETISLSDKAQQKLKQKSSESPLHVLIVDDNAMAREALTNMSESLGWKVDTAADGLMAMAILATRTDGRSPYDVIFMDWKMPGMDGLETARRIREMPHGDKSPVVIMVTAHGRGVLAEQLDDHQFLLDGLLIKPVTPSMLFDAVGQISLGTSDSNGTAPAPGLRRLTGLHLLVVEDNLINQQVARELLTAEGALVEVASNGRQGIEAIIRARIPFDAVLMDVQMPDMDGYEATRQIREELGMTGLPIIAMTANAMPSDREKSLAAGMKAHLSKPVVLNELISVLQQHSGLGGHIQAPREDRPTGGQFDRPGFAVEAALNRLNYNRKVFARMARGFESDQGENIKQLRLLIQQGATEKVKLVLHTLKGVSAILGAMTLSRAAADLESLVHQGQNIDQHHAGVRELFELFVTACQELRLIADELDPPLSYQLPRQTADDLDVAALDSNLAHIQELLEADNLRAVKIYEEVKPQLAARLGSGLESLDMAMNNLAFAEALKMIRKIRQEQAS